MGWVGAYMKIYDGEALWALHATYGFPIEFTIPLCADRGMVPSWEPFFRAAQKDGTNMRKLADRTMMAVQDGYPKDIAVEINKRIPLLLTHMGLS